MNFFEIHKYPSRKNFPVYGNINRLYIDLESNKFYYWEDGKYFKISTTELDQATYDDLNRTLGDTYETIVNSDNKLALKADKTYVDDIAASFNDTNTIPLVEVTWQELKDKRDEGELIPGQQYRITDYVTTTVQENTQSAGHQFDIIVTADAVDKLNENARAAHKKVEEGGELLPWFEHSHSDYPERYFYVDSVVIEGLTLYRWLSHEESNNGDVSQYLLTEKRDVVIGDVVWGYQIIDDGAPVHTDYEEGEENRRTIINVGEGYMSGLDYFANSKLEAWKLKYCLDNDTSRFAWADEVNGKGVIYRMVDEWNNDCPYDFKNIQFLRDGVYYYTFTAFENTDETIKDASIMREMAADDMIDGMTYNSMKPYYIYVDDNVYPQALNFNIFKSYYDDGSMVYMPANNHFELNCYNNFFDDTEFTHSNTFGNGCFSNTFGYSCSNNTFGNSCQSNTFGDNCQNNTFDDYCYANSFGYGCYSNTFGYNCRNNTFGDECSSNTFGNSCQSNTFGEECSDNTFGDNCYANSFGNSCQSNTFGNSCGFNTFGDECSSNTFGDNCYANSFGNRCYYNTFGNYCYYLKISDNTGIQKKFISVDNGFNGASSVNRFDLYDTAILNKDYQVTFKKSASGKYLMLWATDTGTMTGKVKDSNVDDTWEDIV